MKDRLYLMNPGFKNAGLGPFYCGDSACVEGMLGFFPDLREKVDVIYIDFPRPRQALVDALGEEHQSVPVLILADGSSPPRGKSVHKVNGVVFLSDEKEIREYLARKFDLPQAG